MVTTIEIANMAVFSKCMQGEDGLHEMMSAVKNMSELPKTISQLAAMSNKLVETVDAGVEKVKDYAGAIADRVREYCEQNSLTGTVVSVINNVVTNILHILASPAIKTVAIAVASILMHLGILAATSIHAFACLVEKVFAGFNALRGAASTTVEFVGGGHEENANSECESVEEAKHNMGVPSATNEALTMDEDCASMLGMMWTGSTVVTGIKARNPKDFSELVSYFKGQIPTATRDGFFVVRFFQAIMKTLIKIMNMLSDTLFPQKVKLDAVFNDTDLVKLWVDEVLILTQVSNLDKILNDNAWADRVFFAADIAAYLLSKFTSIQELPVSVYAPIRDLALRIFKVRDRCHMAQITPSVYREPFCIWIFGVPGIGKSTFSDSFIAHLLKQEAISWGGERDFVVNSAMTYANRARPGQPVWRFDDMLSVETGIGFSLEAFMGLKTSAPFNPRMARLEDKDMIVNPELVFVLSNHAYAEHIDAITDKEAFHRRRDILVEARAKGSIGDYPPEETALGRHLEFCVYTNSTNTELKNASGKQWIGIDEFKVVAAQKFKAWREKELVLANTRYLQNACSMIETDEHGLRSKLAQVSDASLDTVLRSVREFAYHNMKSREGDGGAGPSKSSADSDDESSGEGDTVPPIRTPLEECELNLRAAKCLEMTNPELAPALKLYVEDVRVEMEKLKPMGQTAESPELIQPYCKGDRSKVCKYSIPAKSMDERCLCYEIERSAQNLTTVVMGENGQNRFNTSHCVHKDFADLVRMADAREWVDVFAAITFNTGVQAFERTEPKYSGTASQVTEKAKLVRVKWPKGTYIPSAACCNGVGNAAVCAFNDSEVMHRTHLLLRKRCPFIYQCGVRPKVYEGFMGYLKMEARSIWYSIKDAYANVVKWCEDNLPTPLVSILSLAGKVLKVLGIIGGVVATGLGALFAVGKVTQYTTGSQCMNDVYRSTVEAIPLLGRAGHQIIASGDATKVARITSRGLAANSYHQSGLQNVAALAARIDANTVYISQYRGEELIQYARCLILSGRELLLIRHYVEAFQKEDDEHVWYTLTMPNATVQWVPEWTAVKWTPLQSFGILTLPARVPLRKSIINFFATEKEHAKFGREAMLVELRRDRCVTHDVLVRRTAVTTTGKGNDGTTSVHIPNAYAYRVHAEGMCGSLLVREDRIYGIHVAGSGLTQSGYSEPLVREHFQPAKIVPVHDIVDILDCDDFPMLQNLMPLGYVRGEYIHHESGRSRIQPSLLNGKLNGAPRTAPGLLSQKDPRANGASPLFLGVAKHGVVCHQIPPKRIRVVQDWLQNREQIILRPQRKEVGLLSFEQSVCGIVGNPYYKAMDMSTSEGFPYTSMKPKGSTGKNWLIEVEDVGGSMKVKFVNKVLVDEIDVKMRLRICGRVPLTVWVDNLKDCRLPLEKCVPGKTRVFSTSPIDFTINFRQFFMDYIAAMMGSRFESMCAVGIACDGVEWTHLRAYLQVAPDWKVMGFDYSNFGPGLIEEVLRASFDDARAWYRFHGAKEEEDLVREVMCEEVCCAIHNMHKWLYQVCAGLPSGCPGTAILNSKVNIYYVAVAWLGIMENSEYADMRSFEENVRLVTYGDDLIMTVSPLVCEVFNMLSIVKELGKYNIVLSPPDKTTVVDKKWMDWDSITFLKRGWTQRDAYTWFAPIEKMSVWECPQWSWSADEKVLSTVVNCDAGCLLAYGHGRKFYDAYVDKLRKALNEQGVHYVPRSWEALDALFFPSLIRVDGYEYASHDMMRRSEQREETPSLPCAPVDNRQFPPEMFFGERVVDAKDALRRYEWYCTLPVFKSDASPDVHVGMFRVPIRMQGLHETDLRDKFMKYVRTTFRGCFASGFVYFRGSVRVKFVNRASGIMRAQHVFDSRPVEGTGIEQILTPIEVTDFFQSGYASVVQACSVNPVVTVEVPFYLPSVMGVLGPGNDDLAFHNRQYMSFGTLLIRIEGMDAPTEVYMSAADDFSMHAFQGFPPMITLENEPATPAEQASHEMMSSAPLVDEQASAEVGEANVCLQVSGEPSASCPNIDLKVFQEVSGQEVNPIVEFENILKRWVRIDTTEWNSTHTMGTVLKTIDLIDVLRTGLENVSGGLPFKMFQYWAGDIELRFEVNSNAFQAGQLQISLGMLPSMRKTSKMQEDVYTRSQRSHVLVSAGGSGEAVLCIPYSYPQPFLPLRGRMWGLGGYHVVEVVVLGRLRGPSSVGDSCSISTFMSIRNSTFTGMIPTTEVGQAEILPATVLAAMAGLNMLMPDANRDKPPYSGASESMVPQSNQSMCVGTNIVEPLNVLRLDARGQTPHPVTAEMSFEQVKRVWGLIDHFVINQATVVGSQLWTREMNMSWVVNKDNYPVVSAGTVNGNEVTMPTYAVPPCDVLQCMFGYGRGSWELRFDVVANHYQRCRIQVAVVPGPAITSLDAARVRASTNAVFTVEGSGQFEFVVPYIAPQPLWPRRFLGGNSVYDFDPLGRVYVFLINKLVNTSTTAKDVEVFVYKRAGVDYQYTCMAQPSISPAYSRLFTLENSGRVIAKSGYYPWYAGVWRSWGESKYGILRYGAGSDHVAQFVNVKEGYYYRLLWQGTEDVPKITWGTGDDKKTEEMEYFLPYVKEGYVYLVPVKAENIAARLRQWKKFLKTQLASVYSKIGYTEVQDPGNEGLYPSKYGNAAFMALKIA